MSMPNSESRKRLTLVPDPVTIDRAELLSRLDAVPDCMSEMQAGLFASWVREVYGDE